MSGLWPWLTLFGLGAFHGINPGMGWLFAVALGLQERSRRKVLAALPPIAVGHALSIGIVAALVWAAQASLPDRALRYGSATILFGFGLYRLLRARHPTWVGMRVGFRDLVLWSFLMASAHGAGLMLVPVLLGWSQGHDGHHGSHTGSLTPQQIIAALDPLRWLAAVLVHTLGHLLVATLIALLVYEKLGLALLQRAWFNLDLLWVIALMLSGVLILIL
ncbi:MAG TPA: hypothetical protein VKM72_27340 [Thermoanaerobaculia bacterium]|nr:hypothetical protein [Thermoanaerobaculia bacterium]